MPSGVIHHEYFKKWRNFIIGISIVLCFLNIWMGLGCLFGYVIIGRYISPDADLISMNLDDGKLMRELKIFGVVIVMWMTLYSYVGQIFGGHRSFFSHSYVFSTFIRLVWIFGIPVFVWYWNYLPITNEMILFGIGMFAGNSISDGIHIYLDFRKHS